MPNNVELLAPAGNVAALHAAVRAGADAVYLGLESFNARRGADNFTLATLEEACAFAHMRARRVYVTLNTAVLPAEVDEALETARQAYRVGADAFIVQDIGIADELARTLPEARLHVSTQMNTHNVAGIEAARRLGAKRVTLARELSLPEVAHLARAAAERGIEVEAFAHGALCVCYSGQCFMSSLIGGRSANRGMCAQACRLPYALLDLDRDEQLPAAGEHLLSPQDLCTVDLLPQLVDAGVASLKIEGRMKSPEYVFAVTAAYRAVLDRVLAARSASDAGEAPSIAGSSVHASDEERRSLAEAFSRGFTTAYLEGARGNEIMSYGRPNNRGVLIGRVSSMRDGVARVALERAVERGDVLEFWTNRGRFAHTVTPDEAGAGTVALAPEKPVGKGDRVFRVRSAAAAFVDDEREPRIPVEGRVRLRVGEPLRIEFRPAAQGSGASPQPFTGVEGIVVEPARTKPVCEADVRAHVDRMGQTPFSLASLDVDLDPCAGIGFSQIHRVRAAALDALAERMAVADGPRPLPRVEPRPRPVPAHPHGVRIVALATNAECARAALRAGAEEVYVPVLNLLPGQAQLVGRLAGKARAEAFPERCGVVLPVADHDQVDGARERACGIDPWSCVRADAPCVAESLGDLVRAADAGLAVEVGPHVPLTNALSLEVAAAIGARRAWLSPELTLEQIARVSEDAPLELGLTVIGSQELMVTEHCLLMSQGPCTERCGTCDRRRRAHVLKDRKGYEFPVVSDALGRGHLFNSVALDVVHAFPDLVHAGVSAFMVDTTLMDANAAHEAVARLVRARSVAHARGEALPKAPGATSGHLFRGVS